MKHKVILYPRQTNKCTLAIISNHDYQEYLIFQRKEFIKDTNAYVGSSAFGGVRHLITFPLLLLGYLDAALSFLSRP